jgi:N-acetylglutamate synthase-like GNAT family acetyltransferase
MSKVDLCPMEIRDIPQCLDILAEAWDAEYAQFAEHDLRDMFVGHRKPPFYYVSRVAGEVTGLAGKAASGVDWGVFEVFHVAVRKAFRRQGLGRLLVERCLKDIDSLDGVTLITTDNPHFYQGFAFVALDENLRCAGTPNTLMRRQSATQRREIAEPR